ncbi:MAG: heat-inducible transcriptional repressor HrcA [Actinobacteria bacterium]|nr:heat-inducible transcriptional repressor HrcA [Actinomycetota bacterium]
MTEVEERRLAVLNAIVAEYIATAQPVGSVHVARLANLSVSSATVRTDMAVLEREGYLVQPHTSAGRVPTEKGYRFYVDHLACPGRLSMSHRIILKNFFSHLHGEVDSLLERSISLLARLTDYASVAVSYYTPDYSAPIRSIQVVGLASHSGLLVIVLGDGTVETQEIDFGQVVSDTVLSEVNAILQRNLVGQLINGELSATDWLGGSYGTRGSRQVHDRLLDGRSVHGRPVDDIVSTVVAALGRMATAAKPEHVFVGGSSHVAAGFDAIDTVRSILSILEQQLVLVDFIEQVLDKGLSVAIGANEHGNALLSECALVIAPFKIGGQDAGSVGVLGPLRMDYPLALAAVNAVGTGLSERLAADAG